jgi:hypothetical protein
VLPTAPSGTPLGAELGVELADGPDAAGLDGSGLDGSELEGTGPDGRAGPADGTVIALDGAAALELAGNAWAAIDACPATWLVHAATRLAPMSNRGNRYDHLMCESYQCAAAGKRPNPVRNLGIESEPGDGSS